MKVPLFFLSIPLSVLSDCLPSADLKSLGFDPTPSIVTSGSFPYCKDVYTKYGACVTSASIADKIASTKRNITTSQLNQINKIVSVFSTKLTLIKGIVARAKQYALENNITASASARLLSYNPSFYDSIREFQNDLYSPSKFSRIFSDSNCDSTQRNSERFLQTASNTNTVKRPAVVVLVKNGTTVSSTAANTVNSTAGKAATNTSTTSTSNTTQASNAANNTTNITASSTSQNKTTTTTTPAANSTAKKTKIMLKGITINKDTLTAFNRIGAVADSSEDILAVLKNATARAKMYEGQFTLTIGSTCVLTSGNGTSIVQRSSNGTITNLGVTSSAATLATVSSIQIIASLCQLVRMQTILQNSINQISNPLAANASNAVDTFCSNSADLTVCAASLDPASCPSSVQNSVLSSFFSPYSDKLTSILDITKFSQAIDQLNSAIVEVQLNGTATTSTTVKTATAQVAIDVVPEWDVVHSSQISFDASSGVIGYQVINDGGDIVLASKSSGVDSTSVEASVTVDTSALTGIGVLEWVGAAALVMLAC